MWVCGHPGESRGELRTAEAQLEWRVNGGTSCMGQCAPAIFPVPELCAHKVAEYRAPHQLDTLAIQRAALWPEGGKGCLAHAWGYPVTSRLVELRKGGVPRHDRRCLDPPKEGSPRHPGGTLIQADSGLHWGHGGCRGVTLLRSGPSGSLVPRTCVQSAATA